MALFSDQPKEFLAEVEEYLWDAPQDNSPGRLGEIRSRLQAGSPVAESVVQLLGTAVGKQRTLYTFVLFIR